jgi:hypothetical protein
MIQEQHESICAALPGPPPSLGVIDACLTADEVRRLKASDVIVVRRPHDIPDFPAEPLRKWSASAVDLGKLWLDQLFPGHDIIVWLDGAGFRITMPSMGRAALRNSGASAD